MSLCPPTSDLYLLMDGEVTFTDRRRLHDHVRVCATCRGRLRAMSLIQGELFARPVPEPRPDYELRLKARLMERMQTSEELARRPRLGVLVAGVAAGFLLIIFAAQWWRPEGHGSKDTVSPSPVVAPHSNTLGTSVKAELERRLADSIRGVWPTAEAVDRLDRALAATGPRLTSLIARRLQDGELSHQVAFEWMRIHGER
ncbi:MAG: zf-HC2 domain-containing protein, partial [Planctomycetes bacterium]|nr:zf-HC2 domain-containing protein [Planctomycetota bacterium]